jgi:hypothetical protein
MMTVALHCRLAGKPARAAAFARFVDHILRHDRVWICRRNEIAEHSLRKAGSFMTATPTTTSCPIGPTITAGHISSSRTRSTTTLALAVERVEIVAQRDEEILGLTPAQATREARVAFWGGHLIGIVRSARSHLAGTRTSRSVPVAKGDGSRVRT